MRQAGPTRYTVKRRETRKAVEITEQTRAAASDGADSGLHEIAALWADTTDVVRAAGRFRIYLRAGAGVGKTQAMHGEARRHRGQGADMVVAFAECHQRRPTEDLMLRPLSPRTRARDHVGSQVTNNLRVTSAPDGNRLVSHVFGSILSGAVWPHPL
jgi:osmosensitive K+ channel His kinase sensor protein